MNAFFQSRWYEAVRYALSVMVVATAGLLPAAQVIDRIVATVNRHAILQSEWDEAVAFECLVNGRQLQNVTPDSRIQTLERLIDQQLVAEQMAASSFVPATAEDIAARASELRQVVPAWKTDEGWRTALATYGLTEEDVRERTGVQVNLTRYLDLRFRPEIHIDRRSMENYYRQQLLPQMRASGLGDTPFEQVAPRIEQLLIEQRLSELQDTWLRALRLQSEIQVR